MIQRDRAPGREIMQDREDDGSRPRAPAASRQHDVLSFASEEFIPAKPPANSLPAQSSSDTPPKRPKPTARLHTGLKMAHKRHRSEDSDDDSESQQQPQALSPVPNRFYDVVKRAFFSRNIVFLGFWNSSRGFRGDVQLPKSGSLPRRILFEASRLNSAAF